jgi:hypothetical protein
VQAIDVFAELLLMFVDVNINRNIFSGNYLPIKKSHRYLCKKEKTMKKILGKMVLICAISVITAGLFKITTSENIAQAQVAEQHWGKDVNGLRCSITVKPTDIKVGETLVIDVEIKNVSPKDICFYYQDLYQAEMLAIKNEKGNIISSSQTARYNWPNPKEFFRQIKAGQSFKKQMKGRVALKSVSALQKQIKTNRSLVIDFFDIAQQIENTGIFTAYLVIKEDQQKETMGKSFGFANIWTGELISNEITLNVKQMTREELDKIIAQLNTGTKEQVIDALEIIKANADKNAVKELMTLLRNSKMPIDKISGALVQIQDSTILPELQQMYQASSKNNLDEQTEYQMYILQTINGLEPNQQKLDELMIKIVKSQDTIPARQYAASYLEMRDNPDAIPALVSVVNNGPRNVQLSATQALGTIGGRLKIEDKPMIIKPLADIIKNNTDSDVRQRAVNALGNVGSNLVVPYLIEALHDSDLFVGSTAASYLGRYGRQDAIAELEEYLSRAQTTGQKSTASDAIKFIRQRISSN